MNTMKYTGILNVFLSFSAELMFNEDKQQTS